MNAERWQRIKPMLEAAIALDPPKRRNYLDSACASDPELRSELESLIASHSQAGTGFLKAPAADLKAPIPLTPDRTGRRIGPYQIVEEIGHGGMGEVYRAVRADGQYTKEVAIKLVRSSFNYAFSQERFRNERQILATLDHPNIARLLDGGTTEDGIPYLVMELIEGSRIDAYCDGQRLSISQRLELFLQVCQAVEYAHQRLVVHRDIKPSNVLVTGEGAPKLLDFGIAKILDPEAGTETTLARPMTPEYASPEQIRGESVTTASDVYSLGVLLYLLLTGRSPYAGENRSALELARAVCETEPGRPSTAFLKLRLPKADEKAEVMTPEQVSRVREGSPAKLRHRLAGDLDDITLKALRKEPLQRYPSPAQFAEDVRRHLEGLPVAASKGSWRYRAEKFVLRNKISVAAGMAVTLALIAGIGATTREARIARHEAEVASEEKARAENRFNDVRQLSDSLIFDVHDALQNLPGSTPVRKLLLDRAVEYLDRVSKDAAGDPDLERELAWGYQRLAVVQGNPAESSLGDLSASLASDRKALALFEEVAKANPTNVIDQLNVAMMHRILSFSTLMEAAGRQDLAQAMAITERLLRQGSTDPKVRSERSIEFQNLAFMQDADGDRVHALESFSQNRALKLDILRTNPNYRRIRRGIGNASVLVADAQARAGSRQEALATMDEAIQFYESVPKGDDEVNVRREVAVTFQKRGDILLMNGNWGLAAASYRQARSVLEPLARADPQNTVLQFDVAGLDYNEGRALAMRGEYSQAITKLQRALEAFQKAPGSSPAAGDSLHGSAAIFIWLGEAYASRGDLSAALRNFQKAATTLEKDAKPPIDASTRCDLAVSYLKTGETLARIKNFPEAEAAYHKALDIMTPLNVPEHRDVPAYYVVAEIHARLGDVAVAKARTAPDAPVRSELYREARTSYERSQSAWQRVPNPARVTPQGYMAGDPRTVARRLAALQRSSAEAIQ